MVKKETKKYKPIKLEIVFESSEELEELYLKPKFKNYILENALDLIERAIIKNKQKVELYNIINLSVIIELERKNFKPVLLKICKLYEDKEEFEMCGIIKKLIKKI
jgi:hypothetical protein